jgi:CsoR family transcriptional regulator, copper-sensing transcriptional repressor
VSRKNGAAKSKTQRVRSLAVLDRESNGLYLSAEDEQAFQHRLSRLEGQVRGIKRMLAEHESCDDILVQVAALKQAVNAVAAELVQAHMATCVLGRIEAGQGKEALESLRASLGRVLKHA